MGSIMHGGINYTGGGISPSEKGAPNGVATLNENGLVPSSQLPSYVDDVLEYASVSAFPATGETGKIYVALDTNLTYRWSGSAYVEISPSLALGETSSTAYRGDRGKTAYDHATESGRSDAKSAGLYKIGVTAQGHIASATAVAKSDLTALGLADQNDVDAIEEDVEGYKTVTGKYITITDGAELPAKAYSLTLSPVQEGSGDPSPSNVRPIHGADEVGVRVCGKNLFDKSTSVTESRFNATGAISYLSGFSRSQFIRCKEGTTYYFKDVLSASNFSAVWWYDKDFVNVGYNAFSGDSDKASGTATAPSGAYYVGINFKESVKDTVCFYESGASDGGYFPYDEHSTTITLPSTVYGGSVEMGGSGISEWGEFTFDGGNDENWVVNGTISHSFTLRVTLPILNIWGTALLSNGISNEAKASNEDAYWGIGSAFAYINSLLYVSNESIDTVADFKTYLAQHPLQIVAKLTTPTSISLTPFPQTLLEGVNNVWAEMKENSVVIDNAQQSLSYQPQNIVGQLRQEIEAKPDSFAQLSDTSFSNLANGQIPKWNSTSQKWENANESGGGGASSLAELSDTNISSPADGQILKWDGTSSKWVNANEYSYTLPTADANTLGGVKVGSGLSINNSGVLSALGIEYYTHTEDITISSSAMVTATMLSDVPAGKYMVFFRYQSPANNNSAVYLMAMLYNNDTDSVVFMSGQEIASSVISMYFVIDISATSTIKLQVGTSSYDPSKTLKDVNVTAIQLP